MVHLDRIYSYLNGASHVPSKNGAPSREVEFLKPQAFSLCSAMQSHFRESPWKNWKIQPGSGWMSPFLVGWWGVNVFIEHHPNPWDIYQRVATSAEKPYNLQQILPNSVMWKISPTMIFTNPWCKSLEKLENQKFQTDPRRNAATCRSRLQHCWAQAPFEPWGSAHQHSSGARKITRFCF